MDYYKLHFNFDLERLQKDLSHCLKIDWPLHFNQNDFTGNWSSFALRSISGNETDILATPNAKFRDTPSLSECSYFREVVDLFQCPKEAVRLLSLSPKSFIKEHRDNSSGYSDGFFRIHVPIQTNDKVIFRLNGNNLPMKPGECWYADFNLPHYVSNEGETDRIHLVIDCLRNDWSDGLFTQYGYDFEAEKRSTYSKETKLQMIEQLLLMNTDTANDIIKELQKEQ